MSDDINKMDFKQLRNQVQILSDQVAIMKRKYEDAIYNLDTANFSGRYIKEQNDFKSAIKMTEKEISLSVSALDGRISTLNIDINSISSRVGMISDELGSEISQRKNLIKMIVKDLDPDTGTAIESIFEQTALGFNLTGNVKVTGNLDITNVERLAGTLYLNDGDNTTSQRIVFSNGDIAGSDNGAIISNISDSIGGMSSLSISGVHVKIGSRVVIDDILDLRDCSQIYWGEHCAVFG